MKYNKICIIGLQEREEREQGIKNLFEEIMTENLPNLEKEKNQTSSRSTESPTEDKPKEVHTKTHHN